MDNEMGPATEPSDSAQMYLVSIGSMRDDGYPVPISLLANTLDISPVSVNEMWSSLILFRLVRHRFG